MSKGETKLWVGIAIGALIAVFALQNNEQAQIDVFFWTVSMPRSLLIAGLFLTGLVVGWLLGAFRKRSA